MLPAAKMNANFFIEEITKTMASIEQVTERLKALISGTNQTYFKQYDTVEGKAFNSLGNLAIIGFCSLNEKCKKCMANRKFIPAQV